MPGFSESILTDVGWDALTDAEAGQHIQYVHMEAGDGNIYGGDEEMFGMTALKHEVMDFPITNFTNDGNGQLTLVGVISSKNVTTGFYLREIGVKATIDGGPELLYCVAYGGTGGDYIPGSAETEVVMQSIQIIIKIDRAPNVTVVVQPGLDVTCQNIGPGTDGAGWFRDKIGSICWFKRVASPKKTIDVVETSDRITIDLPYIDENLDMFVALGNPDIFPHFSRIQYALDYLRPKTIKPGIFVTITVAAGTWSGHPMILVDHPQGSQIKIIGTAGTVKTVTTVSGSATAVRLHGPAGRYTDMVVGDYFIYKNATHSWDSMAISGVRKVKAKAADGSWIEFDPWWYGAFPAVGAITGGTVTPIKTVNVAQAFTPSQYNTGFMTVIGNGLGLLKNMVWVGGPRGADPGWLGYVGLNVEAGSVNCEWCGAYKWVCNTSVWRAGGFGVWKAGYLKMVNCSATECGTGAGSSGAGATAWAEYCYFNSNEHSGFVADSGEGWILFCAMCGNGYRGVAIAEGSSSFFDGILCAYNAGYGYMAVLNVYCGGSEEQSYFHSNSVQDIYLTVSSTIYRVVGPPLAYSTVNIAPGSLSGDGCFFQP